MALLFFACEISLVRLNVVAGKGGPKFALKLKEKRKLLTLNFTRDQSSLTSVFAFYISETTFLSAQSQMIYVYVSLQGNFSETLSGTHRPYRGDE